jgi:hypothetical protein
MNKTISGEHSINETFPRPYISSDYMITKDYKLFIDSKRIFQEDGQIYNGNNISKK